MCILASSLMVINHICQMGIQTFYFGRHVYNITYSTQNLIEEFETFFENPMNRKAYQENPTHNLKKILKTEMQQSASMDQYDYDLALIPLENHTENSLSLENSHFFTTREDDDEGAIKQRLIEHFKKGLKMDVKALQKKRLLGVVEEDNESIVLEGIALLSGQQKVEFNQVTLTKTVEGYEIVAPITKRAKQMVLVIEENEQMQGLLSSSRTLEFINRTPYAITIRHKTCEEESNLNIKVVALNGTITLLKEAYLPKHETYVLYGVAQKNEGNNQNNRPLTKKVIQFYTH
ncbi:MAG: hypothetical protein AB9856_18955 [Cellulosilyticaceae bacterium]